ncbi:MAG: helix-turn-helix domain-containing protein [Aulosira sp. DedQUE10]|nr:helix-turn-helix domain-containing protein [Aulosira sp. DedQUE10]
MNDKLYSPYTEMSVVAFYTRFSMNRGSGLSFPKALERLRNHLLKLSDRIGNANVVELELPKRHKASLLGTIPKTLFRAFYKLSQDGIIEMNGSAIRLCDRDLLIKK